jgi:hypothetical protein
MRRRDADFLPACRHELSHIASSCQLMWGTFTSHGVRPAFVTPLQPHDRVIPTEHWTCTTPTSLPYQHRYYISMVCLPCTLNSLASKKEKKNTPTAAANSIPQPPGARPPQAQTRSTLQRVQTARGTIRRCSSPGATPTAQEKRRRRQNQAETNTVVSARELGLNNGETSHGGRGRQRRRRRQPQPHKTRQKSPRIRCLTTNQPRRRHKRRRDRPPGNPTAKPARRPQHQRSQPPPSSSTRQR